MVRAMKRLLPQADSLEKVILVFASSYAHQDYTQADIADFLQFKNNQTRQSAYYLNACYYLGLVDQYGRPTNVGRTIMKQPQRLNESVYEIVMADAYCGKVIAKMLVNPDGDIKRFIIAMLQKDYAGIYKESTIERRAQTILSWCTEVRDFVNKRR